MPESPNQWRVVAASVCGAGHEKTGQQCQDANRWRLSRDAVIAAVADGAGTAAMGGVGAGIAVRAAVDTLAPGGLPAVIPGDELLVRAQLAEAVRAAKGAVESHAEARAVESRELATTLIVLVAVPTFTAVAQVGDGAVVVRDPQGALSAITVPPANGYVNETTFLTSPGALTSVQFAVRRGEALHIAAFTDGLQMLALRMPGGRPHGPFFAPLFQFMEQTTDADEAQRQLTAFLRSPRVSNRADDDLTLLLAARIR